MSKLIVSEFVTLDGVMEAPGGEPGHPHSGWVFDFMSPEQEQYKFNEVLAAGSHLLGRVTYESFAGAWPQREGPFSDKINSMPKYVVSKRLREVHWQNTTIIDGDVVERIRELKEEDGGDIVMPGSADLLNSLIPHGVIDEYRLMVFPLILGTGKRLFRESTDITHLQLVETRTFESGVTVLTYQPAQEAPDSEFVRSFAWTPEQQRSWEAVRDADRVLATVLFTDIFDSTGKAAALGDLEWRRVLDQHDTASRAEVERYRGRYVKSMGDGILATFDAPSRALRCALGLNDALRGLGLEIRSAIHTGERPNESLGRA